MAPIALGSPVHRHTQLKKVDIVDGFGTRAIHVGSDPDPSTGAVIPAISLSTTYKQDGVGNHKVSFFMSSAAGNSRIAILPVVRS
jgi:cystathionine gamma-lyase